MAEEYSLKKTGKSLTGILNYIPKDEIPVMREEFLNFRGKSALVWQKVGWQKDRVYPGLPWVLVPGYVVSDVYKNENGKDAVKCEPVPDKDKPKLERMIRREGFKGLINFNK